MPSSSVAVVSSACIRRLAVALEVAPVKLGERSEIELVGFPDGLQVFAADRAGIADGVLGPEDDGASPLLEPDVREQPGPAAVAVLKWMNLHGPVMEPNGLVEQGVTGRRLLRPQILNHLEESNLDLRGADADRQFARSEPAGPAPNVAEHLAMESLDPLEIERGKAP